MDLILVSLGCKLKIINTRKIFSSLFLGEVRYHDHGVVKVQGVVGFSIDLIGAVQKGDVQYCQREYNVKFVEGVVEYVRKTKEETKSQS